MRLDPQDRYDSLFMHYAAMNWSRRDGWIERPIPLDWKLLKRQGQAESDLHPEAISRAGAKGLMQFMDATWEEWARNEYGPDAPPRRFISQFDPEQSISAAADMMAWLLRVFQQDIRKALASYNYGVGNVSRLLKTHGPAWEEHLPDETVGYLRKILGEPV